MQLRANSPKDLYAGLIFVTVGMAAFLGAQFYTVGTGLQMGPGYFPALLGAALTGLGVVSIVRGIRLKTSDPIEKRPVYPLVLVISGVFCFALLIDRAGLVPAIIGLLSFVCLPRFLTKPLEVIVTISVVTLASVGLFIYGFGLPILAF